MIELKGYKSIEVYTDGDVIQRELTKANDAWNKKNSLRAGVELQTTLKVDGDGVSVQKISEASVLKKAVLPGVNELKAMAEKRGFEWNNGDDPRVIAWYASDERVDRHGDKVEQSWDFKEYEMNPIMLFSHDWYSPPIGGLLDWGVAPRTDDESYKGDALKVLGMFATKDENPVADTIYRLSKTGFLKSGSVGFYPGEVVRVKDPEEREKLGLGEDGFIFRNNKLVEWSPCTVPANPGAHQLTRAKSMKLIKPGDISVIRELMRVSALTRADEAEKTFKENDEKIRGIWKFLFPDTKLEEHKDITAPFDTPTETEGGIETLLKSQGERLTSLETKVDSVIELLEKGETQPRNESADIPSSNVLGAAALRLAKEKQA